MPTKVEIAPIQKDHRNSPQDWADSYRKGERLFIRRDPEGLIRWGEEMTETLIH